MSENKIKSPLKQIKAYCLHHCMNHQYNEVVHCPLKKCIFYDLRYGKKKPGISSLKSIKAYCTDCSEGIRNIKNCPFPECQLFKFKNGKNPDLKGKRGNRLKGVSPFKMPSL
jgi:hypothetical protein